MGWWLSAEFRDSWTVIKDVILTLGGLTLIMADVFGAAVPSDAVIITGLAMTGIGASFHIGAVIGGFVGKSSGSSSTPAHGPPGLPGSPGSSGERH